MQTQEAYYIALKEEIFYMYNDRDICGNFSSPSRFYLL